LVEYSKLFYIINKINIITISKIYLNTIHEQQTQQNSHAQTKNAKHETITQSTIHTD